MISVFSCEFEFKSHWSSATVYSGSNELKIAFNLNFKNGGEEGGKRKPQRPSSVHTFQLLPATWLHLARPGTWNQDVLEGKEHRWIPARSEFKNKRLIVRIKANLTFTHMHNAECNPPKKQIYLFPIQIGLLYFFLCTLEEIKVKVFSLGNSRKANAFLN